MGHRAEKNRLNHGYHTTMVGTGEKAVYTTDRPSFISHKGDKTKARGRGYANVTKPKRVPTKREHEAVVKGVDDGVHA